MQPKCLARPFIVFYVRDTGQIISRYSALCAADNKMITPQLTEKRPQQHHSIIITRLRFPMFPSSGAFPTYSDIIKQMKQRDHNLATRDIFSIYMLICVVTLLVPSPNSQEPHLALVTV